MYLHIRIISLVLFISEHHIALHEEQPNFVGIINVDMSLRKQLEKWSEYTKRVCEHRYGRAPRVIINGHLNAHFAYLEQPLSYILSEVLKNAMRATLENHVHDAHVPDISVTIGKKPGNQQTIVKKLHSRF
jgi:[3-methyl-2-oxobutanoate dehydrogenase (acetyl-transferring)] kinase